MQLDKRNVSYDFLVIALGSYSEYYGIENIKKFSIPLGKTDDACKIREKIDQIVSEGEGSAIVIGGRLHWNRVSWRNCRTAITRETIVIKNISHRSDELYIAKLEPSACR